MNRLDLIYNKESMEFILERTVWKNELDVYQIEHNNE